MNEMLIPYAASGRLAICAPDQFRLRCCAAIRGLIFCPQSNRCTEKRAIWQWRSRSAACVTVFVASGQVNICNRHRCCRSGSMRLCWSWGSGCWTPGSHDNCGATSCFLWPSRIATLPPAPSTAAPRCGRCRQLLLSMRDVSQHAVGSPSGVGLQLSCQKRERCALILNGGTQLVLVSVQPHPYGQRAAIPRQGHSQQSSVMHQGQHLRRRKGLGHAAFTLAPRPLHSKSAETAAVKCNRVQALAGARLEEAAELLAGAGAPPLAPSLAANIRRALADLRPACVLGQLQVAPLVAFNVHPGCEYRIVCQLADTHTCLCVRALATAVPDSAAAGHSCCCRTCCCCSGAGPMTKPFIVYKHWWLLSCSETPPIQSWILRLS